MPLPSPPHLPDFRAPAARDDVERSVIADIEESGWQGLHIPADDEGPAFTFSVGFYFSYNQPEMLLMGLDGQIAHQLLWDAVRDIQGGARFEPGSFDAQLLDNHKLAIVEIERKRYEDYLGTAMWFYQSLPSFPAIQLVWPDREGRFPWDQGFDERFRPMQDVLGEFKP